MIGAVEISEESITVTVQMQDDETGEVSDVTEPVRHFGWRVTNADGDLVKEVLPEETYGKTKGMVIADAERFADEIGIPTKTKEEALIDIESDIARLNTFHAGELARLEQVKVSLAARVDGLTKADLARLRGGPPG